MRGLQNILTLVARIGSSPTDDDDTRLRKSLLVICTLPFMVAGVIWGIMYYLFGEPWAGAIPLSYSVFVLLSLIHFGLARQFYFFRASQLVLILLLPTLLMAALGGFVSGSAVILWAFICPMGALLFDEPRHALRWFLAFAGAVILSGAAQPFLNSANNLPQELRTIFFVINLLGVGSLVFLMVFYFVGQKNTFQERSETLLLNILPKEIAAILKREQRVIADHYEEASILFADMVNFTPMSAEMSPVEMVDLLNEIFTHFDALVDKHDLEKIKTVGDCYMVAAGVPRPRPDHAQAIVGLALEMRDYVQSQTFKASRPVDFRIGINSGPVLAGVIGRRKFIYDLWGDAVNTASRMESHGAGGLIQITRATYDLIKDDFVCESRGAVNIKGKGEMEAWAVTAAGSNIS